MKKRTLALFLALTLVFSAFALSGCTASNGDDAANDGGDADGGSGYPEKPITVVVGASAGGGLDNSARVASAAVEKQLGQSMVISNVAGAGCTLALIQGKDAKPDGYEVTWIHDSIVLGKITGLIDFSIEAYKCAGIGAVCTNVTFVSSDEFQTFDEIVEYAKANPGELKMGMEMGTYQEQLAAVIMKDMGIDLKMIDTGPANDSIAALAGGHIDLFVAPIGLMTDYIEQGSFVAHGVLSQERDSVYTDLPTMTELGVNYYLPKFFTYLLPLETPQEIVDQFAEAFEAATQDPEYIEGILNLDFTPTYIAPDEAVTYIEDSYAAMESYQNILDEYKASK